MERVLSIDGFERVKNGWHLFVFEGGDVDKGKEVVSEGYDAPAVRIRELRRIFPSQ